MIYRKEDIIRAVRITLDENRDDNMLESFGDVDTLTLDDIIGSRIEEAARRTVELAPASFVGPGNNLDDAVWQESDERRFLLLPDDYLRLSVIRLDCWKRNVYNVLSVGEAARRGVYSRSEALRGTSTKPRAVYAVSELGPVLELYPCSDDAVITKCRYIPIPKFDEDGGIDIPEQCYTPMIYMAASLVLAVLKQTDMVTVMTELWKSTFS